MFTNAETPCTHFLWTLAFGIPERHPAKRCSQYSTRTVDGSSCQRSILLIVRKIDAVRVNPERTECEAELNWDRETTSVKFFSITLSENSTISDRRCIISVHLHPFIYCSFHKVDQFGFWNSHISDAPKVQIKNGSCIHLFQGSTLNKHIVKQKYL